MYLLSSFIYVIGFTLVHFSSKYIRFSNEGYRNNFVSFAAGVSVSYVFVHLLPKLNHYQTIVLENIGNSTWVYIEHHIYIIALFGLISFYSLEHLVKTSKKNALLEELNEGNPYIFWIQITSFFFYNAIIGYLLATEEFESPLSLFFYFIALSVHFMTNDWSLREVHEKSYDKYGRFILALAPIIGWYIGAFTKLNDFVITILLAFVSGGLILNALKDELSDVENSHLISLWAGLVIYTLLLLLT